MVDSFHEMTLRDEDMARYALDADPLPCEAEEHLQNCLCCQQRLGRYVQLNAMLLARLYRSQCPGPNRLSLFCAGLLPADDVIQVAGHLQECPLCAREVTEMRRLLTTTPIED